MFDRALLLNRTMLSTWFVNATMMMGFVVIMPFIPLYVQQLGITDQASIVFWSGAIFSSFGIASFITSPLMGTLSDRIGPKPVIAWGFVVASISFLLMGMTTDLLVLVALRFLQGLFGAGAPAATSSIVANSVPKQKMGQAFGFFQTSMTVAMGTGPLLGGLVADLVGLREAFFVASVLMLIGLLATLLLIEPVRFPAHGPRPGPIQEIRQIASSRTLFIVWIALVVLQVSMFFFIPIYPLFLQEMGIVQVASTMGMLMAIQAVAQTVVTPLAGTMADRRGHRPVLIASLSASGLVTAAIAAATSLAHLIGIQAVSGIAGAGIGPTTSSLVAEAAPKQQRGGAFGILATARTAGVLLGPLIGGVVVQAVGIRGAFVATGVMMGFVAVWISVVLKKPQPRVGEGENGGVGDKPHSSPKGASG